MNNFHIPVLLNESVSYLITNPAGTYVDGTLGFGGHSQNILKHLNKNGKLIALDCDPFAIEKSKEHFKDEPRIIIVNEYYNRIDYALFENGIEKVDGILLDIGISSPQVDMGERGFSFRKDAPLDMRMNPNSKLTAYEIMNFWPIEKIKKILWEYGEEKKSNIISKKIDELRRKKIKIRTTLELAKLVESIYGKKKGKIHPATKTFQALRIAVNNELENLKTFLEKSLNVLKPGGRLVIISYHSLEDRIVKNFIRDNEKGCICPPQFPECRCNGKKRLKRITKKPVIPSQEEITRNPRARSAKMRVAEFLG